MVKKKSDIWDSLIKIRDDNRNEFSIYPLSVAIGKLQIIGYLTACVDYGIITKKEKENIIDDFEKYW
jgi:hypothetical protein